MEMGSPVRLQSPASASRGAKISAGFFSRKTSWNQQKWRIFMDFPGDKNCRNM